MRKGAPLTTSGASGRDALEYWKQRTAHHTAKVANIEGAIAKRKKDTTDKTARAYWLRDRAALDKEQAQCEEQLEKAYATVVNPALQQMRKRHAAARHEHQQQQRQSGENDKENDTPQHVRDHTESTNRQAQRSDDVEGDELLDLYSLEVYQLRQELGPSLDSVRRSVRLLSQQLHQGGGGAASGTTAASARTTAAAVRRAREAESEVRDQMSRLRALIDQETAALAAAEEEVMADISSHRARDTNPESLETSPQQQREQRERREQRGEEGEDAIDAEGGEGAATADSARSSTHIARSSSLASSSTVAADGLGGGGGGGPDLPALFAQTRERLAELHARCPDATLRESFDAIVESQCERATQRLRECEAADGEAGRLPGGGGGGGSRASTSSSGRAPAPLPPPDVMRKVALIVKTASTHPETSAAVTSASTAVALPRPVAAASASAASFDALCLRVYTALPALPRASARAAVSSVLAANRARAVRRSVALDYRQAAAAALAAYAEAIEASALVAAERERARRAAEAAAAETEARHAAVAELRGDYEARQRAAAAAAAAAAAEEQRRQDARAAQRAAEMQERLAAFAEYMERRAALQEAQERERAAAAERERRARQASIAANAPRVAARQAETEARLADRRLTEAAYAQLEREKQEALQRFFDAVERGIGVTADPARVLQSTAASAAAATRAPGDLRRGVTDEEKTGPDDLAARYRYYGYSDAQIMRDPRVRLYHALYEAGLHKTEYGREVATRGYKVSPAQQASDMNPLRGDFF